MQRSTGLLLVTALSLTATACGSGGEPATPSAGGAKAVSITVACQPAKSAPKERQAWDDDVATFMKEHPGVTVKSTDQQPCFDPKTFGPKLAGGQMETAFMVPMTNYADVISKGQALDITPYTSLIKNWNDLRADHKELLTKDGKVYGVPNVHYSVGLVYNRALFTKAGLDPDAPPQTWAEVREAAKKIAGLGAGHIGYGEYSGGNTGGWHFTQALYGRGGDVLTPRRQERRLQLARGQGRAADAARHALGGRQHGHQAPGRLGVADGRHGQRQGRHDARRPRRRDRRRHQVQGQRRRLRHHRLPRGQGVAERRRGVHDQPEGDPLRRPRPRSSGSTSATTPSARAASTSPAARASATRSACPTTRCTATRPPARRSRRTG
ncbi:ABC transporter substrate-binding protein [Nonomuraea salmonea]|uniref:ABC transporter substrate-binding protein n=1 Tax=Nonomuraea salmonea TaxID=46181 RepID=UPI0031F08732